MNIVRLGALSAALAAALSAAGLNGCSTIREYWQYFDGNVETSLREPTGYYDYTKVPEVRNTIRLPSGASMTPDDKNMAIPQAPAGTHTMVGENMDVRAPIVPLRSDAGVHAQWVDGEAIVWLEPEGRHGVHDEAQAWTMLGKVLQRMRVQVGQLTPNAYEFTTLSADFNEFGERYSAGDESASALRYRQVYRVRIGRGQDNSIGIAVSLIGSMTMLPGGKALTNVLNPVELERFAMGFANQIIRTVTSSTALDQALPDSLSVELGRNDAGQDCLIVSAPFDSVFEVLKRMLPRYSFEIKEYSVSHGEFKTAYEEEDPEFYQALGIDSFGLESGDYTLRLGLKGDRTYITFYDEDDEALDTRSVAKLYSGFAKALSQEFNRYRIERINTQTAAQ